ncbi:isocitrate lyase/phosphoenolpyruvate mutase family protein [Dactylosporangium fulvum]|uniref:isocitrate lyase/PEP mutase family protein n=1 Tax=Dactylosporangium fulvum TaxID=53359 RepID=UPI0031CF30FC
MTDQQTRAARFRSLHTSADPIVLANTWDPASARIVAATGAKAVATTSAGVAWTLGVPDGDVLSRDAALEHLARIVAAVPAGLPVTADIESGFGATPAEVAVTIRGVLAADLYINARVDTYLRGGGTVEAPAERAAAFLAAGATGIFVPGVADAATIAALTAAIPAPLNVLAEPETPSVAELAKLGVARVSLGSWVAEAAYAVVRRAAEEAQSKGTYGALAGSIDFGELNGMMSNG